MLIDDHPLHRSQRAQLMHWAPPSGHGGKPPVRVGVEDLGGGDVLLDPAFEATRELSLAPMLLAAPPQGSPSAPEAPTTKRRQRRAVARHTVVPVVPLHHASQVRAHPLDDLVLPDLRLPLSTLRRRSYPRLRITRGRCGSLHLQRQELSSITPRRFLPAQGGLHEPHHLQKTTRRATKKTPRRSAPLSGTERIPQKLPRQCLPFPSKFPFPLLSGHRSSQPVRCHPARRRDHLVWQP